MSTASPFRVGAKVAVTRTGDTGRIVPLTDWPARRPESWSDETMVIVRWDEFMPPAMPAPRAGGLRYSPFTRAEAQELLTVVASAPPRGDAADVARATLAADLRRLARLAESGLLDGESFVLDLHVDSAARVQAVVDALGGEVRRYQSHTDTVQASSAYAYVGSVRVCAMVRTDAPWGEGADSDETWAQLVNPDVTQEAETDAVPAASGVDLFECPEPDCDFAIGAAGPPDPEDLYGFEEEVREHQRSHDPEPTGRPELPRCLACIDHPGWAHADTSRRAEPRDICRECLGSGTPQPKPQGEPADIAEGDGGSHPAVPR